MGKTGVLAIEPHLFDSWKSAWKQTLAVQDGGGVCNLAKQSEAPRLVFELAKVEVRTCWPLEKAICLLTRAFHEQQCLPGMSATILHSAVGDISLEAQNNIQFSTITLSCQIFWESAKTSASGKQLQTHL